MRDGDIIVAFAGSPIERTDDLHRVLTGERAGVQTPMQLLRGVDLIDVTVIPLEPSPVGRVFRP